MKFVEELGLIGMGLRLMMLVLAILAPGTLGAQEDSALPGGPLTYGAFLATFSDDGRFAVEGKGWPKLEGSWKVEGNEVVLAMIMDTTGANRATRGLPDACRKDARYRFQTEGSRLSLDLSGDDECWPRRMILDRSTWRPHDEPEEIPERQIVRTFFGTPGKLPEPASAEGSWPSFRGSQASGIADGQNLPDEWNGENGYNIKWRATVPGLAHSSPIIWGGTLYLTTAVSSHDDATFRPGLYGDGDASDDRSVHRFEVIAFDKLSGEILWRRVAVEAEPIDKRHIKSTYANSTPVTNGQIVVAAFGSNGVYAYDANGHPLWKVDLGRMNLGAYDVPSYEWGPASSPILWQGHVILQVDTQTDAFVLALDAKTGKIVWKTNRDELPTWGTPTVIPAPSGSELVTNGANFIRGYDPKTGEELWRLGRSSKITAPTPIFADGLIVVASGRGPERPIFVIRPGARGDLTLPKGVTSNDAIVWSIERRGPYMPTPLVYDGRLFVLGNNGVFDAYDLATGKELYRQRSPHRGSGFSASPVATDGKIYLSSEDGEILVVRAGPEFEHVATNSMGELLMATPALSEGVMYVRTEESLFAIGRR